PFIGLSCFGLDLAAPLMQPGWRAIVPEHQDPWQSIILPKLSIACAAKVETSRPPRKYGQASVDVGQEQYEARYNARLIKGLEKGGQGTRIPTCCNRSNAICSLGDPATFKRRWTRREPEAGARRSGP